MIGTIAQIVTQFAVAGIAKVRLAARQVRSAFRGIDNTAGRAGRTISRSMAGAARGVSQLGKAIAGIVVNKFTVIGGGIAAIGALALKAAGPLGTLAAGLGAVAAAGIAGIFAKKDVDEVKKFAKAFDSTPEVASNWRTIAESAGLSMDDLSGVMGSLQKSLFDSIDPTSDAARQLKQLGLSARDAGGKLKNTGVFIFDLAERIQKLAPGSRRMVLAEMFGEGEADKMLELMEDLGKGREKFAKDFEARKRDKLLVTQEQIDAFKAFGAAFGDVMIVLRAFARELFLTFAPTFQKFMKSFEGIFRNPAKRQQVIQDFFVKPFQKALQLVRDVVQVFTGIDFMAALFGTQPGQVVNTWLYDLQWWFSTIWSTVLGLTYVGQGFVRVLTDIGRFVERIVQGFTGFSFSDWLNGGASGDFEAFGRDIRSILDDVFAKPIDVSQLETSVGKGFGRFITFLQQKVGPALGDFSSTTIKSVITVFGAIGTAISTAMQDIDRAQASGRGMAGLTTTVGRLAYFAGSAVKWVADLVTNLQKVFILGEGAGPGFEWLEDLRTWLVDNDIAGKLRDIVAMLPTILSSIADALERMAPYLKMAGGLVGKTIGFVAKDIAGENDAGKMATDGIKSGLSAVGGWLLDSVKSAFAFDGFEGAAKRTQAHMDWIGLRDPDDKRGAVAETMATEAAKTDAAVEAAASRAAAKTAEALPPAPAKTPIILQIGTENLPVEGPGDTADRLLRSGAATIGGR